MFNWAKAIKVDLIVIDVARIKDARHNYFKWVSLNDGLKKFCYRGINQIEKISLWLGQLMRELEG